jgi:hypothetical protein
MWYPCVDWSVSSIVLPDCMPTQELMGWRAKNPRTTGYVKRREGVVQSVDAAISLTPPVLPGSRRRTYLLAYFVAADHCLTCFSNHITDAQCINPDVHDVILIPAESIMSLGVGKSWHILARGFFSTVSAIRVLVTFCPNPTVPQPSFDEVYSS